MNTIKWVFLVSSILLTTIPGIVLFRDWRHFDRRTNHYKTITKFLVGLQLLAAGGVALGMYKDLSKREKSPLLIPFLNNLPIKNNVCITFPITNDSKDLEFSFLNVGDETANGLVVSAQFPVVLNVTPSGKWRPVGSIDTTDYSKKLVAVNGKRFTVDADYLTPSNSGAIFPPLTVQATNLSYSLNGLILESSMLNGDSKRWTFSVHFTNGVGDPHLGY